MFAKQKDKYVFLQNYNNRTLYSCVCVSLAFNSVILAVSFKPFSCVCVYVYNEVVLICEHTVHFYASNHACVCASAHNIQVSTLVWILYIYQKVNVCLRVCINNYSVSVGQSTWVQGCEPPSGIRIRVSMCVCVHQYIYISVCVSVCQCQVSYR